MNILFTCAGRRNYLINYFKEALKGEGKVFAADMQLTAPALVDADVALQVPAVYDEEYMPKLEYIIRKYQIDAVISLNDLELPILSKAKERLEALGTKVIVSDENVINICFDKWNTVKFLETIGLKSPQTFIELDKAREAVKRGDFNFPVVVKPRWGSASIGIAFPESMEELELVYKLQSIQLGRTILAEASKEDLSHAILIQEKLSGKEYGIDVLNDLYKNYVGIFVREKLAMRSGETDKAISVIDSNFEKIGRMIGENLKHIGNLDGDLFVKDGEVYILELNPRFGGGYPFSHESGMNTAAIYIEWLKGKNDISAYNNYQTGLMFSKCDRLLKVN